MQENSLHLPRAGARGAFVFLPLFAFNPSCFPCCAAAPTDYYNHVVFDNSITPDYYYYSSGRAVFPSTIELLSGALPVEKKNFFTAPNALRLHWRSVAGGSWETELRVVSMRNRLTDFRGDTLYMWCYSPEAIPAADLPFIQLEDEEHDFTVPVKLDSHLRRRARKTLVSGQATAQRV